MSWFDGRKACPLNADLVSIHSAEEHDYVWRMMNQYQFWIGAAQSLEKKWVWADGTMFDYQPEDSLLPADIPGYCILFGHFLKKTNFWVSAQCFDKHWALCSVKSYDVQI